VNNLTLRFITAIVGIIIVLGAILYNETTSLLLFAFISTMSLIEFYRLAKNDHIQPQIPMGVLTSLLIFLPLLLGSTISTVPNLLPLIIILPYFVFIRELYTKSEKPFTNIGFTLLGVIYISVPLFLFYLIAFHGPDESYRPQNILGMLYLLWASDTGAYTFGRIWGKRKLFERISPKKTWEGFVGGFVFSVIAAFIIAHFYTNFTLIQWLIIAGIIFITGVLGDLVESMFKRSLAIKDSGSLLPGHGGFLDRFDGLFIAAPFVFFYVTMFCN
jgi:phosphatidate cytidylyltransferase